MSEADKSVLPVSSTGKSRKRREKARRMEAMYHAFVAECLKRCETSVLNEYHLWWNCLRLNGKRKQLRNRTLQRWHQEKAHA